LAALEPAGIPWSASPCQGGASSDSGYVAGQSDVGLATDCRRTPEARYRGDKINRGKVSHAPQATTVPYVEDLSEKSHADLVALDFFVIPTVTFRVLFVLAILAHDRRRIVHFNVTEHPTAQWTAQQMIEAFP
jgi:hypothetical protein